MKEQSIILSGPREGAMLIWVYEFTYAKCREVFVRPLE